MSQPNALLQAGIAALKAGDQQEARRFFQQLVTEHPTLETGWLWMSGALSERAEQRYCLEQVLRINPQHEAAQRGLRQLGAVAAQTPAFLRSSAGSGLSPTSTAAAANSSTNAGAQKLGSASTPATPAQTPPVPPRNRVALDALRPAVAAPAAPATPAQTPPVPPRNRVDLDALRPAVAAPAAPTKLPPQAVVAPEPPAVPVSPLPAGPLPNKRGDYLFRVNDQLDAYQIVERVGRSGTRELYLARQEDPNWLFLLLGDDAPPPNMPVKSKLERFTAGERSYIVTPAAGTSLAQLLAIMPELRFPFIGPRWVQLADHLGFLHKSGQVYQASAPFTLDNLVLSGNGTMTSVSYNQPGPGARSFAAPELGRSELAPTADVYSLGASLLAVIGQPTPQAAFAKSARPSGVLGEHPLLIPVLQKATDQTPTKRYRDGEEFARALEGVLGKLALEAGAPLARQPKPKRGTGMLLGLLATAGIIVALLLAWYYAQSQTAKPIEVAAQPTGLALAGLLEIEQVQIEHTPPNAALARIRVTMGDQPLPSEAGVGFVLEHNTAPVQQPRTTSAQPGIFELAFADERPEGMYRLTATLGDASATRSFYYGPGSVAEALDLNSLSLEGMQIDTRRYPEIVTYFSLVNKDGIAAELLGDLEVEVYQDGQRVERFAMQPVNTAEEPVTVALAVDVSGSMRGEAISAARIAAAEFVRQLGPNDQACLYAFATLVQQITECSSDHASTIAAIAGLETIDDTALYDALARVTADQIKRAGRLAIVVLSDGADTKSTTTLDQAFAQVRASSMPVYTIGLLSPQFDGTVLERLSAEADATYLEAPRPEDVAGLYGRVREQLAHQYRVSFTSLFPERNAGEVLVRIKRNGETIEIRRSFAVQR